MNALHQQNNRKKKSSFFSRLTKRQKTTKQPSAFVDQIPLNKEVATVSRKQSIPVMAVIDSTLPSLQSLSSSQSSMDTQSNHATEDSSSSSSKRPKSLYAPCAQNFADLEDEFMEIRVDRWREEMKTFAELETSAQFSMEVDDRRNLAGNKAAIQSRTDQKDEKQTLPVSPLNQPHGPLDTTSDSMPLPVISSKQKGMVEPTLFELDSSLLSELSAINLVEESFSDEDSQESFDGTRSDSDGETLDLPDYEDYHVDDDVEEDGVGVEEDKEVGEQASGAFQVFSFDYLQERLSCITCV